MSHVHDLTSAAGASWARRIPSVVVVLGPLLVALLFLATVWNQPGGLSGDVDEVTSWTSLLAGIPVGVALGSLLLGWFAPRVGAWALALSFVPTLVAGGDVLTGGSIWSVLVASAWVSAVVVDLVLVLRQRTVAAEVQSHLGGSGRWRADHHHGVRLVAAALLSAGIVLAVLLWADWRSDLRAFASREVPVAAEVTKVDTFVDSVFVEIDGTEHELFVNDATDHPVGSTITVHTDPLGRMSPYTDQDADPDSWGAIGVPIGLAGLLLALVVVEVGRRRRRVERLANDGGPAMAVLVRPHPWHDGLEVFATDDPDATRPLAYLPRLEVMVPEDLTPVPADEDDELPEVARAIAVGLVGDGSTCILRIPAGGGELVLASVRPARDSHTVRSLRHAAVTRLLPARARELLEDRRAARPDLEAEGDEADPPAWFAAVLRLARTTARIGPPALTVLGLVATPWLTDGEGFDVGLLPLSFLPASVAAWWWDRGRPRVLRSRWGLRVAESWYDALLLPGEVVHVRRVGDAVEVEDSRGQVLGFHLITELDPLDRERELADLERLVETFHREPPDHFDRWPSGWPRVLPSSATALGLLTYCTWAFSPLL